MLGYLFIPRQYLEGGYWTPAWWEKSLFNFCKYEIPDGYKVILYAEGAPNMRDDKNLIVFQGQKKEQLLILSRLRGFHYIPFERITLDRRDFNKSIRWQGSDVIGHFKIVTHLPVWHFLRQDNLEKIPENLILRGITIEKKEEYQTEAADVLYLKGTFTKIGFFKKMPFPWGFATPVFDFLTQQKGAIAILNDKEKEETIIIVSSVPAHKTFDEETFKTFISTITFDKQVYEPALLKGLEQEPKPNVRYSF